MKAKFIKPIFSGVFAVMLGVISLKAESFNLVTGDGVAITSIDKSALKDILLGKTSYWDGGQAITIVVLTGKTDAAMEETTGMSASAFKTYWQRLTFSGRGKQPKEADSMEKLLSIVSETKGAVAIVPSDADLKGAKKIEVK